MRKLADGEVTYEIRGDDSNLDSDLGKAEEKVKKSAEKAGKASEEAERQAGEKQKEVKEDVTKHHEEQNRKREEDDEKSSKKREDTAEKHGSKLKSIASVSAKAVGAGMLAAGAAVVGIGAKAVSNANDLEKAVNSYAASTGKAKEQTLIFADGTKQVVDQSAQWKEAMQEIYANNYGESFEDISNAMAEVSKQMGYLDDQELKNVTESAFALRDVFEYDIGESVRAADSIVQNFGGSADAAFNLIAQGAQYGLDYSGELLDSINEYSPQFAKLGLNAEDMFQVLASGMENGAFNLDKIGDAVKEL